MPPDTMTNGTRSAAAQLDEQLRDVATSAQIQTGKTQVPPREHDLEFKILDLEPRPNGNPGR